MKRLVTPVEIEYTKASRQKRWQCAPIEDPMDALVQTEIREGSHSPSRNERITFILLPMSEEQH